MAIRIRPIVLSPFAALLVAAVTLQSCGPTTVPTESRKVDTATLAPANPHLADLYRQSCKACHAIQNSGAPLIGDRAQWDARWKKGMPTLLQHVVAGFNGMPAGGQCFSCTAQDYEALIKFLAGRT